MSKEYIEAFRDILGILSAVSGCEVDMNSERIITVKSALQRLESIENAEPSEALKCLENLYTFSEDVIYQFEKEYSTIKQALIKAEKEHNSINLLMQELDCKDFADLRKYARCGYEKLKKQYLKWEDLEFEHKAVFTEAKMGETLYDLVIGFDCTGKETVFLRTDNQQIVFHEKDKQFFNDLHLERVEE